MEYVLHADVGTGKQFIFGFSGAVGPVFIFTVTVDFVVIVVDSSVGTSSSALASPRFVGSTATTAGRG